MTTFDPGEFGGVLLGGTSPTVVVHGGGQVDSDVVFEWDFDNDGDFDEPEETVTGFVMEAESLTGRDFSSHLLGAAGPGQMKVTLDNSDDRFSFFNAASPLTTAPFSLQTGRKIRVRTAESVPNDPVLLARDRFNRPDGPLGTAETGQAWVARASSFAVRGNVAAADPGTFATRILHTVDVGVSAYYAQATLRQVSPRTASSRLVGLVVRWSDASNYTIVYYDSNPAQGIVIQDRDGGVNATLDAYPVQGWEGMTIGAGVVGDVVTAYVGGVPVASGTSTNPGDTEVGLFGEHGAQTGRSPEIGDFHVWDHIAAEVEGILFTGDVTDVQPSVELGPFKVATVTAEGILTRAARSEIASPRLIAGAATGLVVGDVLARANLLHPPQTIAEGTVTTGPVGIDDGKALEIARHLTETERGFLHETPEGHAGYHGADARATATTQAGFSDAPGAQFGYRTITPENRKTQLVNRVTAGVAAEAPAGITRTSPFGTDDVVITMPTVAVGDLLVIFISSTTTGATELWRTPIWWVNHRDIGAARGMRIYSHWCDGTEGGTNVTFYANTSGATGLYVAQLFRIQDWYKGNRGEAVGDLAPGGTSHPLVHGWGRVPTLFIAVRAGMGNPVYPMQFTTAFNAPDGYANTGGTVTNGGGADDAGIMSAWKVDVSDSEAPTEFRGLSNVLIDESVLFAIRGFNGPHTKATLEDPRTTGGDGRFVTVEDVASQDEHNVVQTHPAAPVLFAAEAAAQAYGEAVLGTYADDRPLVQITFPATVSAAYRAQAFRRRVGHKVHLDADNDTGLGISGGFFIEAIAHHWSHAGKQWDVTWQLSPA